MTTAIHLMAGGTIYGSINRAEMSGKIKMSLLAVTLAGSIAPDIDTVSKYWNDGIMYQMWHRGITHSIFLIPVWVLLLSLSYKLIFNIKDKRITIAALAAVSAHIFLDLLNQWGTGILEPFSKGRYSIGTVSFMDLVLPAVMASGLIAGVIKRTGNHKIFRGVSILIAFYILFQSLQGYLLILPLKSSYEQKIVSATQIPGRFRIIGKKGDMVEIMDSSIIKGTSLAYSFVSKDNADLKPLFEEKPEARILYIWSPMLVIIDNENELGIFDPRFYNNGHSFLNESISKKNY